MTITCIFKCENCNEYLCLDNNVVSENGVRIPLNATGLNRLKVHECHCATVTTAIGSADTTVTTTTMTTINTNINQTTADNTETETEETLRKRESDMIRKHNEFLRKYNPWNYVKADESKFCRCTHHVRDHTHFWEGSEEVLCAFAYGNEHYPFSSRYRIKHCSCKGFVSYNRISDKEKT